MNFVFEIVVIMPSESEFCVRVLSFEYNHNPIIAASAQRSPSIAADTIPPA